MQTVDDQRDTLREQAIARLEARREFWMHFTAYVTINTVLVVIWFAISGEGLFWPIFPILGWGIGLLFHGAEVFRRPPTEERIRREMERLEGHHLDDQIENRTLQTR
ncbi:MAG: 2TM domain-containing protein [Nitriliruptorales bacterium]|nr:2TM domain-containing protein [Nitriliruptorales bacterium]